MLIPRFEVPLGLVDGVNRVFSVSHSYQAGSAAVFLNGLLKERSLLDGWVESDPSGGEVTLNEAPRATGPDGPDVVQIFYLDSSTPGCAATQEIVRLSGRLRAVQTLDAHFRALYPLNGHFLAPEGISGMLSSVSAISGTVLEKTPLRASLVMCS